MDIDKVSSVAIYPAIGIARVGNSPGEYFLGPQIPGVPAADPDDFRDSEGRIKRQGVKFHVFALDADGNVLGELNASHGVAISWVVEIANKKSAWYDFDLALDIPAAEGAYDMDGNATPGGQPLLSQRRNREYRGGDRSKLAITPTAKHISGADCGGEGYAFDDGQIDGRPVYLGEVRTDDKGRLIFLGGRGHSASFNGKPLTTFANNEGWHDDTSDGPIAATVTLPDGTVLEAAGAWVATAPPNYAVGVDAFTTGYELLVDVANQRGLVRDAEHTEFHRDVLPVLRHLTVNQWVNAGIAREFGWGTGNDFDNPVLIERLSSTGEADRPLRQAILQAFRDPDYERMQPLSWPPLYGDAVTFNIASTDPRNWYAVTATQFAHLQRWAAGEFSRGAPRPTAWGDMSPQQQADGLTEAALDEALGGPFHPGCEFTWPMRNAIVYESGEAFRIKRRDEAKDDFGMAISHEIAFAPGGPLDGSAAGDITRWMAVPWQSDTSSCLSAYRSYAGEYLPTFWPARVPNDVLTQQDFDVIESKDHSAEEKINAFAPESRKKWLRGFIYNDLGQVIGGSSITDRMKGVERFTEEWYKAGIIIQKPLADAAPLFPASVWVETGRQSVEPDQDAAYSDRPAWISVNPRKLR